MKQAACLFAALLTGCSPAVPSEAGGQAGERPTIVSLNPCADAILAEVTAPGQLLALSHYSHDPKSTSMELEVSAQYPSTGGTVEEVLALRPDVVVASTFLAPATRAALEDLGMRVETVGTVSSLAEAREQVRQLAAVAGDPAAGEALAARMDAATEPSAREPVSAILWQPGGIVPGRGALVTELMTRAGFRSHSAESGMGQADFLSLEQALADPPQVLFVAGSERGQRHPVLAQVPGMEAVTMPANLLYCGGPTIMRAMDYLASVRGELP